MRNIKIIFILIIAGLVLIFGCVQKNNGNENHDDGSMPKNGFMVCKTHTIYHETNPSLLPADSIQKVKKIKDDLPKCLQRISTGLYY